MQTWYTADGWMDKRVKMNEWIDTGWMNKRVWINGWLTYWWMEELIESTNEWMI